MPEANRLLFDIDGSLVVDMDDGGMGGIRAFRAEEEPCFGDQVAHASYADEDGISVSITVNLDEIGRFFELDIWKADNSRLLSYPVPEKIHMIPDCE